LNIRRLLHKFKNILVSSLLVASFFFYSAQNAAAVNDVVRDVDIDNHGGCSTDPFKFDPVGPNDDLTWEMNPVCIAYGVSVGVALYGTGMVANMACNSANPAASSAGAAELSAEKAAGLWVTINTIKRAISGWSSCSAYTSACSPANPTSCAQAAACCSSMASDVVAYGLATAALAIIWQSAVDSQANAHLCGETWNTWEKRAAAQLDEADSEGIYDYQGGLHNDKFYVYGKKAHSYQKYIEDLSSTNFAEISGFDSDHPMKTKEYREYFYGGVEYKDTDGGCSLPNWGDDKLKTILGYDNNQSSKQRYYMRGPKVSSNYACSRFLLYKGTADEEESARKAYECCVQRSKEAVCIEEGNSLNTGSGSTNNLNTKYKFCKLGERCRVQNVWYEIHPARALPNYICASTYSVCPYNHNLGGGTETAEYSPSHQDILTNHCQYLKHCTKIPDTPYIRTSNLDGGWIDSSCSDLRGDSQNNYGFTAQLLPINTKNFSAPIAQCFKETLENIFINKAGHTECLDPDESPNEGVCTSGYLFQAGKVISGQKSFFQSIQDHLQTAIKMVMTIAVTIMGVGVLLTGKTWDQKTLIMFIVKLGLVAFFALGTAWQDTFFVGVSRTSMALADIFMNVDVGQLENKKDGCQFPKYNAQIMKDSGVMDSSNPSYPKGREYLAIWDMLDCKIVRALGFGLDASVPNLIYMILAGFLTGGLGIIFFVGVFIFAFYLLALTIRALHIFLISSIAITLLIYVSPITITACLFKRTEGIFKQWRKNLIGFVLQPVILFCYLGIVITIFEAIIIGDATFSGNGIDAPKQIICSSGNAANNSIYCIFKIRNVKTMNALAPIGIGLPVLLDMNSEKMATITKSALLMFILTQFLDKITKLAASIVGGSELKSASSGALSMLGSAYGAVNAVQSRGKNATQRLGGQVAEKSGLNKVAAAVGSSVNNKAEAAGASVKRGAESVGSSIKKGLGMDKKS